CVLEDFSRLKPEKLIFYDEIKFEVVRNNNNTRLLCSQCDSRCMVSVVLEARDLENVYICSRSCLSSYLRIVHFSSQNEGLRLIGTCDGASSITVKSNIRHCEQQNRFLGTGRVGSKSGLRRLRLTVSVSLILNGPKIRLVITDGPM
ncbi:unnamed protein product, partial [Brassica oleracea var. botrytis]